MAQHPAIVPGRVAVITGAASGIGLAAARRLGAAGMRVVVADVAEAALHAAAGELRAEGIDARPVLTDVSDRDAVAALKAAADQAGEVSFLMNNAGREGGGGLLAGPEVWRRVLETNFLGVLWGVQLFLPDNCGNRMCGCQFHFVVDGARAGIEQPPEEAGKAKHVIDLVGKIAAPGGDHPRYIGNRVGLDFGLWVRHHKDDGVDLHGGDVGDFEHLAAPETDEDIRFSQRLLDGFFITHRNIRNAITLEQPAGSGARRACTVDDHT